MKFFKGNQIRIHIGVSALENIHVRVNKVLTME